MLRNISADLQKHEQKTESESLGHTIFANHYLAPGLFRACWCKHLDTTCDSPDIIDNRSDAVKYFTPPIGDLCVGTTRHAQEIVSVPSGGLYAQVFVRTVTRDIVIARDGVTVFGCWYLSRLLFS